jgi:hypothetical protein
MNKHIKVPNNESAYIKERWQIHFRDFKEARKIFLNQNIDHIYQKVP